MSLHSTRAYEWLSSSFDVRGLVGCIMLCISFAETDTVNKKVVPSNVGRHPPIVSAAVGSYL